MPRHHAPATALSCREVIDTCRHILSVFVFILVYKYQNLGLLYMCECDRVSANVQVGMNQDLAGGNSVLHT